MTYGFFETMIRIAAVAVLSVPASRLQV